MKQVKTIAWAAAAAAVAGVFALLFLLYLLPRPDAPGGGFATAPSTTETCRPCHRSIYDSYVKTGHFLTSSAATRDAVMGDFREGRNVVGTPVRGLRFTMEKSRSGFFQTGTYSADSTSSFSKPFHLVVGSGERAQTYLFWEGNRLFQLPGMYFTPEATWTLGPGYENWIAAWEDLPRKSVSMLFQRPIGGRCLECHASAATRVGSPTGFEFRPGSLETGISCEKCHGPGERHVAFHEKHPDVEEGRHILDPANLSRSRQLSSCALCHSGQGMPRTPSLSFRPGDEISEHRVYPEAERMKLSVHGGQVPFLEESRCFNESDSMTCSTCHDVHVDQTGQTAAFSQKCLDCHPQSHPDDAELAQGDSCTDCHMPDQQAMNLPVYHEGEEWFLSMANHRVGIFQKPGDDPR